MFKDSVIVENKIPETAMVDGNFPFAKAIIVFRTLKVRSLIHLLNNSMFKKNKALVYKSSL